MFGYLLGLELVLDSCFCDNAVVGVVLLFELDYYFKFDSEKLSFKVVLVYFISFFYDEIFPELERIVNGNSFFSPLPPLPFSFSAIVISFFKLPD